jgi:hypothetical protein
MDSKILSLVIEDMRRRELVGKSKYQCSMDRNDLKTEDWITHLKEELMDAILYLKKIETKLNEKDNGLR